jgi:hypothetical protein
MKQEENELRSKTTRRQIIASILMTVVVIPLVYFFLSVTENMSTDIRIAKATFGTMHALAPPWFWTLLLLCPLVLGLTQGGLR